MRRKGLIGKETRSFTNLLYTAPSNSYTTVTTQMKNYSKKRNTWQAVKKQFVELGRIIGLYEKQETTVNKFYIKNFSK